MRKGGGGVYIYVCVYMDEMRKGGGNVGMEE